MSWLSTGLRSRAAANPRLLRRIRYARELDDLWYLRSDLMAELSLRHGEAQA